MLKSLFEILATEYSGLNVFRYLTFRAICSILTALVMSFVIGPLLIRKLNDLKSERQFGRMVQSLISISRALQLWVVR